MATLLSRGEISKKGCSIVTYGAIKKNSYEVYVMSMPVLHCHRNTEININSDEWFFDAMPRVSILIVNFDLMAIVGTIILLPYL